MIKHFRVDKMRSIQVETEARDGSEKFEKFDMGDYAKQTFSMFGGTLERVKLVCDKNARGESLPNERPLLTAPRRETIRLGTTVLKLFHEQIILLVGNLRIGICFNGISFLLQELNYRRDSYI